ncbi:hypothetical protein [Cellulosilyticum sp. WCF-2]|uniref:hypothetical protein n=1 Tax=Cellulosilyticum sp. WCF-2 TaxID=2497860 RepID=UPI0016805230|nr:hypothetical protein [Cellulosilyticum sp. WCF-2]
MIKEISKQEAQEIVKNRMPFGCFIVVGDESFIALENTTGDAQIEPFETEAAAKRWLRS